jgi:hypothetical protein
MRMDSYWSKWVGVQEVSLLDPRMDFWTQGLPTFSGPYGWAPVDLCWVSYHALSYGNPD